MKYLESLKGLVDVYNVQLEENHIINIHQTVNGCNLFIICKDESGYYARYHFDLACYQYDISELLEANEYEKTIEIIGIYTSITTMIEKSISRNKLKQIDDNSLSHNKLIDLGFTDTFKTGSIYHISITKSVMMSIDLGGNVSIGDELDLEYLVLTIDQLKSLYKSLTNKEL